MSCHFSHYVPHCNYFCKDECCLGTPTSHQDKSSFFLLCSSNVMHLTYRGSSEECVFGSVALWYRGKHCSSISCNIRPMLLVWDTLWAARVQSAPTKAMDHSYFTLLWEKSSLAVIESYYYRAARVCQTQWAPVSSQQRWYYCGHCFTDREMEALRSEAICLSYWTQVFLASSLSS